MFGMSSSDTFFAILAIVYGLYMEWRMYVTHRWPRK